MRKWFTAFLALSVPVVAQNIPFSSDETLRYTVNWPSGLDVGDARFNAARSEEGAGEPALWQFSFALDAAIPGFSVNDEYQAKADADLCSLFFRKELAHGKRKTKEEITIDQAAHTAHRKTIGGGESEISVPKCAMDALTFFYHVRRELARGRIPPSQTVIFGAPYEVELEAAGSQEVALRGETVDADQFTVTVRGPASEAMFLLVVARDEARTPVRITAPMEPGNFTMELAAEE